MCKDASTEARLAVWSLRAKYRSSTVVRPLAKYPMCDSLERPVQNGSGIFVL
jgi:hypothetical protein